MLEYPDDIALVLLKLISGSELTNNEKLVLQEWTQESPANNEMLNFMLNDDLLKRDFVEYYSLKNSMKGEVERETVIELNTQNQSSKISRRKLQLITAAASLIIIAGASIIFSNTDKKSTEKSSSNGFGEPSSSPVVVVLPAIQQAELRLDNKKIDLSQSSEVEISTSGSAIINGRVEENNASIESLYTLSTPKGGFYHLTLSDGTKVWLNAATELKFPKIFNGSIRRVQLEGEAFFSVSKNGKQPFIIETEKGEVEVLGTSFNLKIYQHEPMTTSLISGSVKVIAGPEKRSAKIIAPGQQAVVRSNDAFIQVNEFVDNPIAWRENSFSFFNTNLKDVLQEISRWYNVEVKIDNNAVEKIVLNGGFDRRLSLDRLLPHLSDMSGLKLYLKNRTIIVGDK